MAPRNPTSGEVQQYVHIDSGETVGAFAGTEMDKVLRDDAEYELVTRRNAAKEAAEEAASAEGTDDGEEGQAGDGPVDPADHSRPELNQLAEEAGVENPEALDNKSAVADAINAKRAEGTDDGEE